MHRRETASSAAFASIDEPATHSIRTQGAQMSLLDNRARCARWAGLGGLIRPRLASARETRAPAAAASKLGVATSRDKRWWHGTIAPIEPWRPVGHANGVHAM